MTSQCETKDSGQTGADTAPAATRFMPFIFVLLWPTGFIGAKYGLPYAEAFTFLSLRFLIVLPIVALIAFATRSHWPDRHGIAYSLAVGALIHGGYLCGVFWAIGAGLPAGIAAVIVGLQPILTAVLAGFVLAERVTRLQWIGLWLGLGGIVAVLSPALVAGSSAAMGSAAALPIAGFVAAFVALATMTGGTLLQKSAGGGIALWPGAFWQYAAALAVSGPLALILETNDVSWTVEFIGALLWLSLVLSIGVISLLVLMLRQDALSKVSALFYTVPPMAAIMAFLLFGETLNLIQLAGIAVTAFAIKLASGAPTRPAAKS